MPAYSPADPPLAFIAIPVGLVVLFVWGVAASYRRSGASPTTSRHATLLATVGAAAWMLLGDQVARTGILREWERTPPPIAFLVLSIVLLAVWLALGPVGRRMAHHLPLWILVAVQGFRLPLELAMHGMYERGVMPAQMSYVGWNFDIVTGATALLVAPLVAIQAAGWRLVLAWNVLGLLLLVNIITVSILSTPRVAYFGPDALNVWVTYPPFIWLPTVMVLAALAGHLVIFRAVLHSRVSAHGSSPTRPAEERF